MERELNLAQFPRVSTSGAPAADRLDQARQRSAAMLNAADQTLDAIDALLAEEFLQQSRQRSAQ